MGLDEENSLFPQLTRAARKHYEQNGWSRWQIKKQ
jgi:hypothetical protein